jgi:hypothetical protein
LNGPSAGQSHYHKLTHGAVFFRFFFSLLKGAVDEVDSGISRMFITGVSPVTMDDVTSGFNIGQNISLYPTFNDVLGLNQQNVVEMLAGRIPIFRVRKLINDSECLTDKD